MKQLLNLFHYLIISVIKVISKGTKDSGGDSKIIIKPFVAYTNSELTKVRVMGRVLQSFSHKKYFYEDKKMPWLKHFKKTIQLFFSVGVADHEIDVRIGKEVFKIKSNDYGFFNENFELSDRPQIHDQRLKVTFHLTNEGIDAISKTHALVPTEQSHKIFISDIDDTILKSKATSMFSMAFKTLMYPPHKRKIFPEVTRSYKELEKGPDGGLNNLFFYVSSSTWDIFPLLSEFLKTNKLPKGPLILQDLKGEKNKKHTNDHGHKIDRISEISNHYPDLPLVLIGDAGQADSQIYLEIAKTFPNRVDAILIRRTWWQKNIKDTTEHIQRAKKLGVSFKYFDNLEDMGTISF